MTDEIIDEFLRYLAIDKGLSETYQQSVLQSLNHLKKWCATHSLQVGSLTTEHLSQFIAELDDTHDLASSSKRLLLVHIKIFFRYIFLKEIISKDVAEPLITPKVEKKLPETCSIKHIEDLLKSLDTSDKLAKRDKAILELFYSSGLRLSEISNAKLEWVDFDEQWIRVIGKGSKTRMLPIGGPAFAALSDYLEKERPLLLKGKPNSAYLFISIRGTQLSPQRIRDMVKKRAVKAGLSQNIYPHLMRHSFATHLLENGANLKVIQELLGHTDLATTQIYTAVNQKHLQSIHQQFHPRQKKP